MKSVEDVIERQKEAREKRRAVDLPDDEVIARATPKPFDTPEATPEAAIEPRTAFGKWWRKVRGAVDKAKERFNAWLVGERLRIVTHDVCCSRLLLSFIPVHRVS